MQFVATKGSPPAGSHYSQAVKANGFIFLAGQLPVDASGGLVLDTTYNQARQVLKNVAAILKAAGSGLGHVVSVTVYVSDLSYWAAVDDAFADAFGDHRPARTTVVSPQLHYGADVEMQVVAVDPD